jgi:polar amino acid transport system substrate-binding protein
VSAAILLVTLAPPALAGCDRTLTISASDYPPYVYRDPRRQWVGLDVEVMRAVFAEAGCSYRFAPLVPPRRMVEMVSEGKTDVLLAASDTPERERANRFGPAYRDETVSLVGLAGKVDALRDAKDFATLQQRGVRLLLPNAGWFGDDYARALPGLRAAGLVVEYTYLDQAARMLAVGRATLLMGDTAAIVAAARRERIAIEALPATVTRAPIHMMFSKASVSEHDFRELSGATERLLQRGRLQAIARAYGLQ